MTCRPAAGLAAMATIVLLSTPTASARISDDLVKIGVLTDLSGPASDATGDGSVLADAGKLVRPAEPKHSGAPDLRALQ
jgi:hypothetical protein